MAPCSATHNACTCHQADAPSAAAAAAAAAACKAERLGLHIQCLALDALPVDGHETLHLEGLARRRHALDPSLDILEAPLAGCGGPLRDNLAALVFHQRSLGKAAGGLLLGAAHDQGLR